MLEIYAKLSSFLCRAAQEEAVIPAVRRWQQRSARTAAASCGAWRLSCSATGAAVLRGWSRIEVHFYRVAKCFPQQPVLLLGKKHGDFKDCTGSGQHSSLFGRIYLQPWQLGAACFPTFRQWIKNLQDYREGRLSKYILKTTSFFFVSTGIQFSSICKKFQRWSGVSVGTSVGLLWSPLHFEGKWLQMNF